MKTNRREFLKLGGGAILLSMGAFNFGCSLQPLVDGKDKKVALIYATRYGATKDTAEWITEGMGREVDLLDIEKISFADTAKKYDLFIIGSGVWIDGVHKDMLRFLETQKPLLKDKIIASFILCGTTGEDIKGDERIEQYFSKFHSSLDKKPPLSEKFGGRIVIEQLNAKDRKMLEVFYERVLKREFVSWDRTEPEKADIFGKSTQEYI